MLSVTKQLPSNTTVPRYTSKPIEIPNERRYVYDNNENSTSTIQNTPPNDFMKHLSKRIDQFATSPSFVYNLRN